jgi:hypothetical protein
MPYLVWGEELFFDATKVEANASIDSARSRSLLGDRLEEHHREGRHTRLHGVARARQTHLPFHHRGLRLRPREGPLQLPCGRDLAPPGPRSQGRVREVRREDVGVVGVPPQEQVHEHSEGAMGQPWSGRGVHRKGQVVPRNRSLPQGLT